MVPQKGKDILIAGLDIGSTSVRMAVGQLLHGADGKGLHILGTAEVASEGIHKGAITSIEDAVSSVSACLEKMERSIGAPIDRVWVGVNGHEIMTSGNKGVVAIARGNGEVTDEDVSRVVEAAKTIATPLNFEILHVIPRFFRVDGSNPIKDPVGMSGVRLEVDALIVQASSAHIRNISKAVYRTGLEIHDMVLSLLAASEVVTSERARDMGVVVLDVGAATTSMVVIEGGDVIHAAFIPIGSEHITADLAIGLRTSIEIAHSVKIKDGTAHVKGLTKRDEIDLYEHGSPNHEKIPRKYIAEIIEARVEEIFQKVEEELKSIGRDGMLPAGIVCIGGGSKIHGLLDVAKRTLRLPASLGYPMNITSVTDSVNDVGFSNVIGLVKWGYDIVGAQVLQPKWSKMVNKISEGAGSLDTVKKWIKSLLP